MSSPPQHQPHNSSHSALQNRTKSNRPHASSSCSAATTLEFFSSLKQVSAATKAYRILSVVSTPNANTGSRVCRAVHRKSKQVVALKSVSRLQFSRHPQRETRLQTEIEIQRELCHPHILPLLNVLCSAHEVHLISEWAEGGTMLDYVNSQRGGFTEDLVRLYATQLVDAICYAHRCGVVHRDIKLENILFRDRRRRHILLADWGMSDRWSPDRLLTLPCGSSFYCAPSIMRHRPYRGPEIDVWSLGVVLYTLAFGQLPFRGKTTTELFRAIVLRTRHGASSLFGPAEFSASIGLQDLLLRMLEPKARYRITMDQIATHPWVTGTMNSLPRHLQDDQLAAVTTSRSMPATVRRRLFITEEEDERGAQPERSPPDPHSNPEFLEPEEELSSPERCDNAAHQRTTGANQPPSTGSEQNTCVNQPPPAGSEHDADLSTASVQLTASTPQQHAGAEHLACSPPRTADAGVSHSSPSLAGSSQSQPGSRSPERWQADDSPTSPRHAHSPTSPRHAHSPTSPRHAHSPMSRASSKKSNEESTTGKKQNSARKSKSKKSKLISPVSAITKALRHSHSDVTRLQSVPRSSAPLPKPPSAASAAARLTKLPDLRAERSSSKDAAGISHSPRSPQDSPRTAKLSSSPGEEAVFFSSSLPSNLTPYNSLRSQFSGSLGSLPSSPVNRHASAAGAQHAPASARHPRPLSDLVGIAGGSVLHDRSDLEYMVPIAPRGSVVEMSTSPRGLPSLFSLHSPPFTRQRCGSASATLLAQGSSLRASISQPSALNTTLLASSPPSGAGSHAHRQHHRHHHRRHHHHSTHPAPANRERRASVLGLVRPPQQHPPPPDHLPGDPLPELANSHSGSNLATSPRSRFAAVSRPRSHSSITGGSMFSNSLGGGASSSSGGSSTNLLFGRSLQHEGRDSPLPTAADATIRLSPDEHHYHHHYHYQEATPAVPIATARRRSLDQ